MCAKILVSSVGKSDKHPGLQKHEGVCDSTGNHNQRGLLEEDFFHWSLGLTVLDGLRVKAGHAGGEQKSFDSVVVMIAEDGFGVGGDHSHALH